MEKKMKKEMLLIMAGAALLIFTAGQACAFSVADDMGEGLSLHVEQDSTKYKYDSLNANTPNSMTEFDFFSETTVEHRHFKGDCEILSLHHAMNEGICMDTLPEVASN